MFGASVLNKIQSPGICTTLANQRSNMVQQNVHSQKPETKLRPHQNQLENSKGQQNNPKSNQIQNTTVSRPLRPPRWFIASRRLTLTFLPPTRLSLFGRPLVIGWRRLGFTGVLTYRVHLRTPRLAFFSVCASLGEGCGSLVSRPRKGTYTVACRCLGSPLGQSSC